MLQTYHDVKNSCSFTKNYNTVIFFFNVLFCDVIFELLKVFFNIFLILCIIYNKASHEQFNIQTKIQCNELLPVVCMDI